MKFQSAARLAAMMLLAGSAAGCFFSPGVSPAVVYGGTGGLGDTGVISQSGGLTLQQFTTNTSQIDKNSPITFTVVTTGGSNLNFAWSATKGTLSGNSGRNVSWSAYKADGSLDVGTASITVTITDAAGDVVTGTLNIAVAANGTATVITPSAAPASASPSTAATATPTAAATATAAPTATPSATATATATPAASPTASADAGATSTAGATSAATAS